MSQRNTDAGLVDPGGGINVVRWGVGGSLTMVESSYNLTVMYFW